MPSGPKKRRAAKKKKEIQAKINTKIDDKSPNEVGATSSSPVDGVANIVGCEFAESVLNENARKSLTTNEEIVAQDLTNEFEFLNELIHVDDKVVQDKSDENEKYVSFEEQVHVLDIAVQADSESEETEKAIGEIEETAFGKEGVLEDDNSAQNVSKENVEAVFSDFTDELAAKEADKFGTEGRNLFPVLDTAIDESLAVQSLPNEVTQTYFGCSMENDESVLSDFINELDAKEDDKFGTEARNLLPVLDTAIDESLAVQSLPNEATQTYFGCPMHCNSSCSFYQLFSSQGKFGIEEINLGSIVEQVERIKKTVEVELQVVDKMRATLQKVLDDLTVFQLSQG